MLAHVLVGARSLVLEELRVRVGQAGHHFVVGASHQDLVGLGEGHDPLRHVDAVADDVGLPVQVLDQLYRPEVDADPHLQRDGSALRGRCYGVPQRDANEQRILGIADKTDRRAVAGVENDAIVRGDILERLGEQRVELLFEPDLFGNRLPRILDDIDEDDAADECPVSPRQHALIRDS